jgi:hypothetical protein
MVRDAGDVMRNALFIFVIAGAVLSGCPRRVTIDPDYVQDRNNSDWRVKSEPADSTKPRQR